MVVGEELRMRTIDGVRDKSCVVMRFFYLIRSRNKGSGTIGLSEQLAREIELKNYTH